jgi:hypothetical protein
VATTITIDFTSGALTPATSSSIVVSPAAANKLAVQTQPSATATAGVTFAQQPVIRVEDQFGNLISDDNTSEVTATRAAGSGALQGATTLTASGGVVIYTNLSHNVANNITIEFTRTGLTPVTSDLIAINPATATHLAFTIQPSNAVAGAAFGTQPVVKSRDQFGNDSTVDLPASLDVTVALTAGDGPLLGTTNLDIGTAAGNGVATFTDLQIDAVGADKQLIASATGFTNALSDVFTVKGHTTNVVVSSANPSLPGSNITFTATLTAVAPATGTPTGTVQFVVDSSPFGSPVTLVGGVATLDTASLSHGSHTVTAEYAGDTLFLGSTNSLSPDQVVNTAPVPRLHTLGVVQDTTNNVSASKLTRGDADADSDALSVTAVSATSTNGGSVSLASGIVTYVPTASYVGDDLFTYTLSDGYTNVTGTVLVTVRSSGAVSQNVFPPTTLPDGNKRIKFAGIPGRTYYIQATTDLAPPSWVPIGTNVVGGTGLSTFDDLDATNYPSRYYRTIAP